MHWRRRLLGFAAGIVLLGAGCGAPPGIMILAPGNGSFEPGASILVTGVVLGIDPAAIADVRVNGVSVLPLTNDMFSTTVSLDPVAIVNPIVAEVIGPSGTVLRDRVTVIAGDSIADGDFSEDSVALRFAEAGLNELEPFVTSQVPLDLATLVPPGTLVVNDFCYQETFLGCIGRVDATVSGNPPPSVGSFSLDIDPATNAVEGDITLFDLFFRTDVVAVTGVGFSCTIDITAATTAIAGDYGLDPDAVDPSVVDVTQLGNVAVSFGAFNDSTDCGGFLGFIVEFFIGLVIADLQNDFVKPGIENFLNTVDVDGNTPLAAAIETALAGIEIAGPIGEALGVSLETPLFDVAEDVDGITFGNDARITASMPAPLAPDLLASYHVDQAFPTFGTLAPNGLPYELGMCISASAFNQLLKAEIESGLLFTTISEFDFGSGPVPITGALLAFLLPAFGVLDPAEVLQVDVVPTLAPFVTGDPGPMGELATLRLAHLGLKIVPVVDPTVTLLEVAVDGELGLDASFTAGDLAFTVTPPTAQDLSFTLLENPLLADEATIDGLLPQLLTLVIPTLGDSLGSFPLPAFLGLELSLVDVDQNGEFISLFLDLSPTP
jgi:hypothetical protein